MVLETLAAVGTKAAVGTEAAGAEGLAVHELELVVGRTNPLSSKKWTCCEGGNRQNCKRGDL